MFSESFLLGNSRLDATFLDSRKKRKFLLNTSAMPRLRKKGFGGGYQGINDLD
jgi:hypothetical protein